MSRDRGRGAKLRSLKAVLGLSFKSDPLRTIAALTLYPLARLEGPMIAFGLKLAVDAAVGGEWRGLVIAVFAVVAALCVLHIVDHTAWQLCLWLDDRVALALDQRIIELVSRPEGIEHFERPEYLDRLEVLREQGWTLGRAMYSLPMSIADVVRAIVTFSLLASVHPLMLLLIPVAIPSLLIDLNIDSRYRRLQEESAPDLRRARHLFELSTGQAAGKELRLFGLRDELFSRHRAEWTLLRQRFMHAERGMVARSLLGWLVFACGFLAAVGFVAWRVSRGESGVGDLVLAFTLAAQVNRETRVSVQLVSWSRWVFSISKHLLWLEEFADRHGVQGHGLEDMPPKAKEATTVRAEGGIQPVRVPDRINKAIELRSVSFAYPGTDRLTLSDVTLTLPAGSTVAIVGENGAGKSTLVKLLLRMYRPDQGSITVDGADLQLFASADWRSACTASFQDFYSFAFRARESIGIGNLRSLDDESAIHRAVADAHAGDVIHSLPEGLDTQLGSRWEGGAELSTGQWQRLALARSMMRTDPLVQFLDEPTAALDPQTEYELFQRYIEASQERPNGAVSLIISHRFSSVAAADVIYVLDRGRVVEQGDHHELMRLGGTYAELYRIQAEALFGRTADS